MNSLFEFAYIAGLIAIWSGLVVTLWRFYQLAFRLTVLGALRFTAVSVALACLLYLPAAVAGSWAFCLSAKVGLCVFGGYAGTGLVAAGVVLVLRSVRAGRVLVVA
ncbi:hypothetical protein B3C1_15087 [Gallaecimonas xiamenensis 3-C-1]|uniref:Uncharacterized protein n=1 Tax=Gallaecimonas xiamenensis 3-C-1 TaxID=745411 RepID=K2J3H8_9GAMM|nr:hypothetical protein B3C1_15087 [Gallaecimonas xiamenensis 3-C-1]